MYSCGIGNATEKGVVTSIARRGATIMMNFVIERLFGCSHKRTTFPLTPKRSSANAGAYVTCLDCGREFAYNWAEMRIEKALARPVGAGAPQPLPQPAEGLSRLL